MVKYTQKLDSLGKVYLPKILRDAGLSPTVDIVPNSIAAVMYPSGARIAHVLQSLKAITAQLETMDQLSQRSSTRTKREKPRR